MSPVYFKDRDQLTTYSWPQSLCKIINEVYVVDADHGPVASHLGRNHQVEELGVHHEIELASIEAASRKHVDELHRAVSISESQPGSFCKTIMPEATVGEVLCEGLL